MVDAYIKDYDVLYRRYLNLQQKEEHLHIVNDFVLSLLHENTLHDIVWMLAKQVIAKLNFSDCVIYLVEEDKKQLIQVAAHGPKNPIALDILNPITIPIGEGIVGSVALTGEAEIVEDTRKDNRYILDDAMRLSEIAVPIIFKEKVIGVIDSEHPDVGFYTQEHLVLLSTIAAIASTKIMHARSIEELKEYKDRLEEKVDIQTQALKKTIAHLRKSNQDLESFAYAASHDLKEPLRTIISYLQLLEKKETALSGSSREFLNFAIDGSKRMERLLAGLLEYSQLKNNNDEKELVDMNLIIELIGANLTASIKEKNARIVHKNLPPIFGNKTQIIQLFQNLISNAFKFCENGVHPIVTIDAYQQEGKVYFKVTDNGIGIAPEFHKKIFELFRRLNTIGDYAGSGIGLSLCKRIVDYHNGDIQIESEKGKGTTFVIAFPAFDF